MALKELFEIELKCAKILTGEYQKKTLLTI